jgi:peptidyl-prolyl cis-trans isomerase SurA
MRWQSWTLPAVVAGGLIGCGTSRSGAPDIPPMIGLMRVDPTPVARAQQPDALPPSNPILRTNLQQVAAPGDIRVIVRIRATVNNTPILEDEIREAMYSHVVALQSLPEPERTRTRKRLEKEELLKIIDREVVLTEALTQLQKARPHLVEKLRDAAAKEFDKNLRNIKAKAAAAGTPITTDEELRAAFAAQGLSMDGMRRQVERSFMMMEYMRSRIFPTMEKVGHEAILDYYHEHPGEFQIEDRVAWKDLFVDVSHFGSRDAARAYAQQVLARAQRGEDFQTLIKEYTSRYYSFSNGDGYGQRRGEIRPPEAEPILFDLRDGETGPLIEQANGFHVIKLIKRDHAGLQPLDDKIQSEIRKKIQNLIGEREYKRILAELKQKAVIQIFDEP